MSAWEMNVFDNDSALDWVEELLESSGIEALEQALVGVLNADDYLEVDEGSAGLAAIEVINLLNGHGPDEAPTSITDWIEQNSDADISDLLPLARQALDKISDTDASEVAQLWLEADDDWNGLIADIRSRLDI